MHVGTTSFDPAHLPIVTELISFLLALMGSDQQLEFVSAQQLLGNIRSEVATPSSKCVGTAAVMHFGIAPQYIHNLQQGGKDRHSINT